MSSENKKSGYTYIISVSYKSGCYRHIKITESATLFNLHEAIIYAFDFIDDHAHAFFMNNIAWDESEGYYSEIIEDAEKFTCDYTLKKLKLVVGDKFKYIFDFGEEWCFQCKLLRKIEEQIDDITVVRSKGDIVQYSGWEDEDEEYE